MKILSLAYRERIEKACGSLKQRTGFDYFVCYIVFNNRQTFVLSNMFDMLKTYYLDFYYKEDYCFREQSTSNVSYYLCQNNAHVTKRFEEMLENQYSLFRTYYIIRNCPECQFIFGAINSTKIDNYEKVYASTLKDFEDFCCSFVDDTLDIIKQYNPGYIFSIVLNDAAYRKKIIKSGAFGKDRLTKKEMATLYWAAYGKSSEETARILNVSSSTIEFHRKEIKQKLNAVNITHAVFEGLKLGYIGAFNQAWCHLDRNNLTTNDVKTKTVENNFNNLWLLNQR